MSKKLTLSEVRKKYLEEITKNLEVAIAIRDNPSVSDKERINAVKEINWMLGVRRPDKTVPKPEQKSKKQPELTEEDKERINDAFKLDE